MGAEKIKLRSLTIPFNIENKNARTYTKESFSDECLDHMQKCIADDIFLGELKHKNLNWPNPEKVSPSKISHKVTKAEINDEGLNIEIELMKTPDGHIASKIIKKWLKDGGEAPFSIASRSIGDIDKKGYIHIDRIISFDLIPKEESSFDEGIKLLDDQEL